MMITWNNFEWFALSAIILWGSGAGFALFSRERSRWAILLTLLGILVLQCLLQDSGSICNVLPCAPWVKPDCGIPFYGSIRSADLYSLEISMDFVLFYCGRCCICFSQYIETGNSRPVPYACLAESMVYPSCNHLYVFLFRVGLRLYSVVHGTLQTSGKLLGGCR